jgi:prepilin-type N-terminal cleavage/methylation domain-containing protein
MKQRPQPARTGFTLVELLLALVIITIVTLIGVPAIGPMISGSGVDSAARLLNRSLMKARSAAVTRRETGTCWIAAGSVYESGTLEPVSTETITHDFTGENAIIIDNNSGSSQVEIIGTWNTSTWTGGGSFWGANFLHDRDEEKGAKSVRYTPDLPVEGEYNVHIYRPEHSSRPNNVPIDITHKNGMTTVTHNQVSGGGWLDLGTYDFNAGTGGNVLIRTTDTSGVVVADAIKFEAMIVIPGGNPATQFQAVGKSWAENLWAGTGESRYYVTVSNRLGANQTQTVVAPVKENDENILTADETWKSLNGDSVTLQSGSSFLIQLGDPRSPPNRTQSVGSGSPDQLSWATLPQGTFVDIKDPVTGEGVWPITFTSSGRAVLPGSAPYVTIRVTSSDAPESSSHWRFIRVYRNTGRTVTARSLSDFTD